MIFIKYQFTIKNKNNRFANKKTELGLEYLNIYLESLFIRFLVNIQLKLLLLMILIFE